MRKENYESIQPNDNGDDDGNRTGRAETVKRLAHDSCGMRRQQNHVDFAGNKVIEASDDRLQERRQSRYLDAAKDLATVSGVIKSTSE